MSQSITTEIIDKPISGKHTGTAKTIRKLKLNYPELSEKQIAKKVGCTPSNVHVVLSRFFKDDSDHDLKDFQEFKADIYDSLQKRLLKSITDDKLIKMQVYPAVVSAGILEDKARTIRGQATGINVSVLLDLVQALKG